MTLHVYGDSHCSRWRDIHINDLIIMIHDIGPATASSFGLESTLVVDMKRDDVNPYDVVCFVMGEIDCRAHIHKHKDAHKDLIDEIVKHYFIGIKNVVSISDLTVLVSFITPVPKKKDDIYGNNILFNPIGEDFERKVYVEYMNQKIKEECEKYNYIFIDVYKEYCNEEGFLEPTLSDGGIHIGDMTFVTEKIKEILKSKF